MAIPECFLAVAVELFFSVHGFDDSMRVFQYARPEFRLPSSIVAVVRLIFYLGSLVSVHAGYKQL